MNTIWPVSMPPCPILAAGNVIEAFISSTDKMIFVILNVDEKLYVRELHNLTLHTPSTSSIFQHGNAISFNPEHCRNGYTINKVWRSMREYYKDNP